MRLSVNGKLKQNGSTHEMIFSAAELVSYISRFMSLQVGDVILTGTPAGVGFATETYLKPGDLVRIEVEGCGVLENPVLASV